MKYEESEKVELKREFNSDIAKELIAFLNTCDGTIYIGVNDDGTINKIVDKDKLNLQVTNIINDAIYPNPREFIKLSFNEDDVLEISVRKGNERPYF